MDLNLITSKISGVIINLNYLEKKDPHLVLPIKHCQLDRCYKVLTRRGLAFNLQVIIEVYNLWFINSVHF